MCSAYDSIWIVIRTRAIVRRVNFIKLGRHRNLIVAGGCAGPHYNGCCLGIAGITWIDVHAEAEIRVEWRRYLGFQAKVILRI